MPERAPPHRGVNECVLRERRGCGRVSPFDDRWTWGVLLSEALMPDSREPRKLRPFVAGSLSEERGAGSGLLDGDRVQGLVRRPRAERRHYSLKRWRLVVREGKHRMYTEDVTDRTPYRPEDRRDALSGKRRTPGITTGFDRGGAAVARKSWVPGET
jgi:hypothetical protein